LDTRHFIAGFEPRSGEFIPAGGPEKPFPSAARQMSYEEIDNLVHDRQDIVPVFIA
jgi:hypothetical protein